MRVAAGMILLAAPVAAQAAGDAVQVDVPAGTLGTAVATLSRQARIDIGVDDPALHRVATSPVRGRMSAEEALERILRGTAATWLRGRGGLFHIVGRPRPVAVQASMGTAGRRKRYVVPPPPVTDIVVTASKRGAALADYPATVAIFSGDEFGAAGISPGSEAITLRLAGVGSTHMGRGRNKLFVRGIIDSSFHGPSQVATAQYLDHVRINHNGPDPDLRLYDIAAVEVLEGPQGTLYGAGSLGGVIRVVTNRPQLDRTEGRVSAGVTHVAHGDPGGDAAAMLNLPLARGVAGLRLVGYASREGGYIDNPVLGLSDVNGVSVRGGRAALRLMVGGWTADLGGVLQSIRADDSQWTDRDGAPLTRSSLVREAYATDYRQANAAVERDLGAARLVASLAAVERSATQHYDDGTPSAVVQKARSDLLVGEARISQRQSDGAGWVAGLGFLDSESLVRRSNGPVGDDALLRQRVANSAREITLFGEAGMAVAPRLVVTAGLRLSHTRLHGEAWAKESLATLPGTGKPIAVGLVRSDVRALPSLALSLRASERLFVFARYQEGFRPGGVGVAGFKPEIHRGDRLRSWEVGQRLTRGDAFALDIAASYARWDGIAAEVVSQTGDLTTANIGDGEIVSIEARADWRPVPGWRAGGGLFLNRSRLTRSNIGTIALKGARLPNVPRLGLQARIGREWALGTGLRASLAVDARYFGGSRIGAGPLLDTAQGDYVDDRVLLRVGDAMRGLSLEATNLADGATNRFALGTPYRIYHPQATPQRPRTIRIGFDAAF
ncbi:outer membrane receptor protein involved in Fe transport [Sphingopyxis sp. OAS728]|uniref:TonB-dependent receptor n=1 Tax=Sphingopyxis sp. OAS728 TaxID=2663823 RepID=UPI00178B8E50|nr:TonB-dependent receptor [Sphingopyxis sp. OAS728]MBE1529101.1 outer membrane receptor protein involved in Fe transport [Sphingopyxis sp. OAS728]